MGIRTAARAIVISEGKLLVIRNQGREGVFYVLPGGGQDLGERLDQTVVRECKEETGLSVTAGSLLCVREYIAKNHEFAELQGDFHQVEALFFCRLNDHTQQDSTVPSVPDYLQVGVEWLPLHNLEEYRLYPQDLRQLIAGLDERHPAMYGYLGDVT